MRMVRRPHVLPRDGDTTCPSNHYREIGVPLYYDCPGVLSGLRLIECFCESSPLTSPTVLPSPLILAVSPIKLGLGKLGTPGTSSAPLVPGLLVTILLALLLPDRELPLLPTLLIACLALVALLAKNCLQSPDCRLPRSATTIRPP